MTTCAYKDGIIVSDGQVSAGDRVDCVDLKKVRKINNCLVAGAGRLSSVFAFFDWFEEWSDAQVVQGQAPHVRVFVPEGIDDEDFQGLVIFSDKVIFHYEGGKKSFTIPGETYAAIGSGSDYALAAMDAGASAEEAVKVAIKRDVFSGGQTFVEELDEEEEEISYDKAKDLTKEELLELLFPDQEESITIPESSVVFENDHVLLTDEGVVNFGILDRMTDTYQVFYSIGLEDTDKDSEEFQYFVLEMSDLYLVNVLESLTGEHTAFTNEKDAIADKIFEILDNKYQEFLNAE